MASLTNPTTGQTITVPDDAADAYTSRGWVRPGTPALAEQHGLDTMSIPQLREHARVHGINLGTLRLKADIRAAIDTAGHEQ